MRNYWLIIFCLAGVAGCQLSKDDRGTVTQVEPEFNIDLFEELGQAGNFQIKVQTIENQPCTNNLIDFFSSRAGTRIFLDLNAIEQADDCLVGNQPIDTMASYGFLSNGKYPVEITLKNTVLNEGTLEVADERYQLSFDNKYGFEIVHEELLRVPARTIWGYVAYSNQGASAVADNFLRAIEDGTQALTLPEGYFGHFLIQDGQKLALPQAPEFSFF
ncbi:MAG: hypothetical protein HY842_09210 [Bacteroidetes bacterium]|nr:hypothetical protein [Bacteroidota bacterium]